MVHSWWRVDGLSTGKMAEGLEDELSRVQNSDILLLHAASRLQLSLHGFVRNSSEISAAKVSSI